MILAGAVGVSDHVKIGKKSIIAAGSGLNKDVPDGEKYFGYPARPMMQAIKEQAATVRLPALLKQNRQQEKSIKSLIERVEKLEQLLINDT